MITGRSLIKKPVIQSFVPFCPSFPVAHIAINTPNLNPLKMWANIVNLTDFGSVITPKTVKKFGVLACSSKMKIIKYKVEYFIGGCRLLLITKSHCFLYRMDPPVDKRRTLITQQSTVWTRRQHAVCVRRAKKRYGSKENPNVILDNLNMTVPKGTM